MHRFQLEARAASAPNHPNILTIYDVGQAEGSHYIATEYIEGETLRERMNGKRMDVREMLPIAIQMAGALAEAHRAGIVHRDIKPENVMLRPSGLVKVLDFGLAKLSEETVPTDDSATRTVAAMDTAFGTVMGTYRYMSPEQARGVKVDARSDIFSLGVVLYELAAGEAPFQGETASYVVVGILEKEPSPLARCAPGIPAELERIVAKALRKGREERYQSAADLHAELKKLKQDLELRARFVETPAAAAAGASAMSSAPAPAPKRWRWWRSTSARRNRTSNCCACWKSGWRRPDTPSSSTGI